MLDVDPLAACMDFLKTYGWNAGSIQRINSPPEESWIWSDLHLSGRDGAERFSKHFQRGFVTPEEMNRYILKQWRDRVAANERIICLGDVVTRGDALADEALVAAIRSCPGQRVLVRGNHDVEDLDALRAAGFIEQYWGAVCETDPPLVLTHAPLKHVPPDTVNVHGHHHIHKGTEVPTPHINVVVESIHYAPVQLSEVVTEARKLLDRGRGERSPSSESFRSARPRPHRLRP